MALRQTQRLIAMSTRDIFWGEKAVGVDCLEIWKVPGTLGACTGNGLPLPCLIRR